MRCIIRAAIRAFSGLCGAVLAVVFAILPSPQTAAQTAPQSLFTLAGNHPAETADLTAVARADARLPMQVTLALRNGAALDQLLRDQQNPASPQYHRWLTPQQFRARFGPSQADVDAVAQWAASQGLQVTDTSLEQRYVRFSGTVSEA